jgi:cell division protein FtsB
LRIVRPLLHGLVLTGVAALLLVALAGDRGRLAILRLESARSELLDGIRELEAENRELELAVRQLRDPDDAAEAILREVFGYVREDELLYREAPSRPGTVVPAGEGTPAPAD